jgi:hypothetical protein
MGSRFARNMTPSHSVFYSHINALGAFSRGVNVPRLFTRIAIARGDVEPDISLARILRCNTASGR